MKRSPRVRRLFRRLVSNLEDRGNREGGGDISVRLRKAIFFLLGEDMLVVLNDGRGLVDDGDLGAQAAKGAAEARAPLGSQGGQVMAEGALLLIAGADRDGPDIDHIALSRVPQREGEGRVEQGERELRGGQRVGGGCCRGSCR